MTTYCCPPFYLAIETETKTNEGEVTRVGEWVRQCDRGGAQEGPKVVGECKRSVMVPVLGRRKCLRGVWERHALYILLVASAVRWRGSPGVTERDRVRGGNFIASQGRVLVNLECRGRSWLRRGSGVAGGGTAVAGSERRAKRRAAGGGCIRKYALRLGRAELEEGLNGRVRPPKPFLSQVHVEKRKAWAAEMLELTAKDWHDVIFSDDSKFNLFGSGGSIGGGGHMEV
ncbi:hypothetical protein C8J57DRAFT_1258770 [Mycena rebaudengoi]|nr:hypothetical protein C8J57DRAFT_1258770 [Mycena rebaudengoi]